MDLIDLRDDALIVISMEGEQSKAAIAKALLQSRKELREHQALLIRANKMVRKWKQNDITSNLKFSKEEVQDGLSYLLDFFRGFLTPSSSAVSSPSSSITSSHKKVSGESGPVQNAASSSLIASEKETIDLEPLNLVTTSSWQSGISARPSLHQRKVVTKDYGVRKWFGLVVEEII